jgi:hypothetical protein
LSRVKKSYKKSDFIINHSDHPFGSLAASSNG